MTLTQFVGACVGITLTISIASIWLLDRRWFRYVFWTWVIFFLAVMTVI